MVIVQKNIRRFIMFALIRYEYDWYKFETVVAVSKDKRKLVEEYNKLGINKKEWTERVLVGTKWHKILDSQGGPHYYISKIKYLE
jgi:hypothetical protein